MEGSEAIQYPVPMSVDEYLAEERLSEVRHEYVAGHVYAMAGASKNHERVSLALAAALLGHTRGGPCEVFKSDMKVQVEVMANTTFYYPDIVVACDPSDGDSHFLNNPKVIVEVLSEDERRDRIEKFLIYQHLPSLEEYVVISQNPKRPEVSIFRRDESWAPGHIHKSGEFELASIGFKGRVEDLYDW
jgi:Uma2 family endonuclease